MIVRRLVTILLLGLLLLPSFSFLVPYAEAKKPDWAVPGVYFEYEQGIQCQGRGESPWFRFTLERADEQQGIWPRAFVEYPSDWRCSKSASPIGGGGRDQEPHIIRWDVGPDSPGFYYPPTLARQQGIPIVGLRSPILGRSLVFKTPEGTYYDASTGILLVTSGEFRWTLKQTNVKWPSGQCPEFIITPTLPPADRPLQTVRPSGDRTSYRISFEWGGGIPAHASWSAHVRDERGVAPAGIIASFDFEEGPISRQGSRLLDVRTSSAQEGRYAIRIVASVKDPETGETCSAETTVLLEVTKERSEVPLGALFPKVGKVDAVKGDVQITNGTSGVKTRATTGREVRVNDLLRTGSDPNTIVGIVSRDGVVQLWKDTAIVFLGLEQQINPDGTKRLRVVGPPQPHTVCENAGPRCELFYNSIIQLGIPANLLPSPETNPVAIYLIQGVLRMVSREYQEGLKRIDLIMTHSSVIAPRGTEFTVEVAPDGSTKVMVLEGWVDIGLRSRITYNIRLERLGLLIPIDVVELEDESAIRRSLAIQRVDASTIDRWWEPSATSVPQPPAPTTKPTPPSTTVNVTFVTGIPNEMAFMTVVGFAVAGLVASIWRRRNLARNIAILGGIFIIAAFILRNFSEGDYDCMRNAAGEAVKCGYTTGVQGAIASVISSFFVGAIMLIVAPIKVVFDRRHASSTQSPPAKQSRAQQLPKVPSLHVVPASPPQEPVAKSADEEMTLF